MHKGDVVHAVCGAWGQGSWHRYTSLLDWRCGVGLRRESWINVFVINVAATGVDARSAWRAIHTHRVVPGGKFNWLGCDLVMRKVTGGCIASAIPVLTWRNITVQY